MLAVVAGGAEPDDSHAFNQHAASAIREAASALPLKLDTDTVSTLSTSIALAAQNHSQMSLDLHYLQDHITDFTYTVLSTKRLKATFLWFH